MMKINQYRDHRSFIEQKAKAFQGNNWVGNILKAITQLMMDAGPILFKDGLYRKPNIFRLIKLGGLALRFILDLNKNKE